MPKISIITPCYNGEGTIREMIKSVQSQTYSNWELIIVDDSSRDSTKEVIGEIAKVDSRIRYFRTEKPSGSPSHPRNIGIDNAMGKYVAFLDADDLWLPDKLQKQIEFLEKHNYNFVYSFYEKIDWDGNRANRIVRTRKETRYDNLLKSNSIPCLTSLVSLEAIGNTRFKEIPQEDFCFWLDILKKGYVAYNLCEVTALYRESKNSRSSNKIDMFKGYWNVIRKYQKIPFFSACVDMVAYTYNGISKYIK